MYHRFVIFFGFLLSLQHLGVSFPPHAIALTSECQSNTSGTVAAIDYILLGANDIREERFDSALQNYNCATIFAPEYAVPYNNQGWVFFRQQKYEDAIAAYNIAIRYDAKNSVIFNNRGQVFDKLGYSKLADQDYRYAFKLNPKNSVTYPTNNQGIAIAAPTKPELLFPSESEYQEAFHVYDHLIETIPSVTSFINRGNIYRYSGDIDNAIADFTKALELGSDNALAYFSRGLAYYDSGKLELSIQDLKASILINPNEARTYFWLGVAYLEAVQYDNARMALRGAIELDPVWAVCYWELGETFMRNGDRKSALKYYNVYLAVAGAEAPPLFVGIVDSMSS